MSAGVAVAIEPFFLDGPHGRLFALEVAPADGDADLAVLLCPPFAEELNRTRRAVQLAARRMATQGCAVLLLDLHGTGDSEGDFGDASWEGWRADLASGAAWLRAHRTERLALWGVRLGCALALDLAVPLECEHLLLWQPVTNGATFLKQFLRLRVAADMLAAEGASSVDALRAELAGGASLEIAGYAITPAMARAVEALDATRVDAARLPTVDWIEAALAPERPLSVPSRALIERWEAAGVRVRAQAAVAPQFWGTPEIVVPESFLAASERVARDWARVESPA